MRAAAAAQLRYNDTPFDGVGVGQDEGGEVQKARESKIFSFIDRVMNERMTESRNTKCTLRAPQHPCGGSSSNNESMRIGKCGEGSGGG